MFLQVNLHVAKLLGIKFLQVQINFHSIKIMESHDIVTTKKQKFSNPLSTLSTLPQPTLNPPSTLPQPSLNPPQPTLNPHPSTLQWFKWLLACS